MGELRGGKVFIEVKHGYESNLLERLKTQADEYLNIAKEGKTRF
jgi:hypothetical protein